MSLDRLEKVVDVVLSYGSPKAKLNAVKEFSKKQLSLVSLFAGAGGMDIGFEKAGFKTVWANEYDKTISPSYQKYFPKN
jgi:DNA (cytosine-5)-methyltransferase 1